MKHDHPSSSHHSPLRSIANLPRFVLRKLRRLFKKKPAQHSDDRHKTGSVTDLRQPPKMADIIDHNIETIISLHLLAERKSDHHQRFFERATIYMSRPRFFYITIAIVFGWMLLNIFSEHLNWPPFDPAPFVWLQGSITLSGLLLTIVVLITQNRQSRRSERQKHMSLQINLIAEHKVSKLIALVEELRRDMPIVRDRFDQEAAVMAEAVDPEVMFTLLDETLDELNEELSQLNIVPQPERIVDSDEPDSPQAQQEEQDSL